MKPIKMIELNYKEKEALGKALKIVHDVAKQAKTDELAVMQYFMDEKTESERYGYLTGALHRVSEIKSYEKNEKKELAYLETSKGYIDFRCTSCGTTFRDYILTLSPDKTFPKFCPECGAKFSTRPIKEVKSDDKERSS